MPKRRSSLSLLIPSSIAAALLFAYTTYSQSTQKQPPEVLTWDNLNTQLAESSPTALNVEKFSTVPQYAALLKVNDRAIFNDMVSQGKYPLVAIAGVAAIQKTDPDAAFASAMRALANAESPSDYSWGLIIPFLDKTKAPAEKTFIAQFEQICSYTSTNRSGLRVVVEILPSESLSSWLQSPPLTRTATNESVIVDRLYPEYLNAKKVVPEWLQKKLDTYRNIPGSPRVTFLYYADATEANLSELIPTTLEDPSLPDSEIISLVRKRKEFILRAIDVKSLKTNANRIDLIQRVLKPQK